MKGNLYKCMKIILIFYCPYPNLPPIGGRSSNYLSGGF
jgi:hypothetical protein